MNKDYTPKFEYQVWKVDCDGVGEILRQGKGNASSLERMGEMLWHTIQERWGDDAESVSWTVWLIEDNTIYLEYEGSRLIKKAI